MVTGHRLAAISSSVEWCIDSGEKVRSKKKCVSIECGLGVLDLVTDSGILRGAGADTNNLTPLVINLDTRTADVDAGSLISFVRSFETKHLISLKSFSDRPQKCHDLRKVIEASEFN